MPPRTRFLICDAMRCIPRGAILSFLRGLFLVVAAGSSMNRFQRANKSCGLTGVCRRKRADLSPRVWFLTSTADTKPCYFGSQRLCAASPSATAAGLSDLCLTRTCFLHCPRGVTGSGQSSLRLRSKASAPSHDGISFLSRFSLSRNLTLFDPEVAIRGGEDELSEVPSKLAVKSCAMRSPSPFCLRIFLRKTLMVSPGAGLGA